MLANDKTAVILGAPMARAMRPESTAEAPLPSAPGVAGPGCNHHG